MVDDDIPGATTGRYRLGRLLGAGSSGRVYEAIDTERGGRLAVKRLHRDGPLDVARLKREFRTLADVAHPNLVGLLELDQIGDEVLLAMDLVEGRNLLDWVWDRTGPTVDAGSTAAPTWSTLYATPIGGVVAEGAPPTLDRAAIDRLRQALRGLAAGLSALHASGLLHRDVKPSNVLITDEGRVVLLDFGLAARPEAVRGGLAGTAAYMAPEQIGGDHVTPAADWYGLGCVLYEALSGRTPFLGPAVHVLFAKRSEDPCDIRALAPDAPADLAALCMALLARDPDARPTGDEVCRALGVTPSEAATPVPFVGRAAELGALRALLSERGLRVVHVSGASGLGKTRLVQRLLGEVGDDTVVLAGRCYEREMTPFKAVDPLIDELATRLSADAGLRAEALVGVDLGAVARLFPALIRLAAAYGLPEVDAEPADPLTERRRAAEGLRLLLVRLAAARRVVVWIDDLQWGDLDSARLLATILRQPGAPRLMLILGWRSDDPQVQPLLEPLASVPAVRLELRALLELEARALVGMELGGPDGHTLLIERVLGEAGGSPFFLGEIARWLASGGESDGPLLDAVIADRVAALPEPARRLLEAVAVAGRPIPPDVALTAARRSAPDAGPAELALLTVRRLLTTRRGQALECTHDRIREAVSAAVPTSSLPSVHRALAGALGPDADPEVLAEHWAHAGEPGRAAGYALKGARQAEAGLAFERAVALYRRALALGTLQGGSRHDVEVALGRVMARAGHGDAADVLLAAAEAAPAAQRVGLQREAIHQLLRTGHIERAYRLLPEALEAVGERWPRSPWGGLPAVLWVSARPRWLPRLGRGSPEALTLVMELAMSLAYADMLRSAYFTARAIALAERIRTPETRALASAMRGSNASLLGDLAAGQRWLGASMAALPAGAGAGLRAQVELHHALGAVSQARFADAREILERCIAVFERQAMPYEVGMAQSFLSMAILQLGDLPAFRELQARVVQEARQRGDRHLEVLFRVCSVLQPGLLDDDPGAALDNLREAADRWGEGVSTLWMYGEVGRAQVDIYRDRPQDARARLAQVTQAAARRGLLRVEINALSVHIARAAAAAAMAGYDADARKELEHAIRAIAALRTPVARSQVHVWRSAARSADHDRQGAIEALRHALDAFRTAPCVWQEELIRARLARLRGEDPTPYLEAVAARGVAAPERLARVFAGPSDPAAP